MRKRLGTTWCRISGTLDVNWDRINVTDLPMIDIEPDEREQVFGLKQGDVLICEGARASARRRSGCRIATVCISEALHRLRPWSNDEVHATSILHAKRRGDGVYLAEALQRFRI